MIIIGDVTLGQLLLAGLRQYLPGTAIQAAITGHRSGGLLTPDAAIRVRVSAARGVAQSPARVCHAT
jgi:hypothetical protein